MSPTRAAAAPPSDVQACVDAVRRLVRGLRLAEQATRAEAGLSAAQLFVLRQLAEREATSVGDLAASTLTDRSSVAAVVERLAESGLVAAARDDADRRRILVRLTPSGRARLRHAPPAPTTLLVQALGQMSAASRRSLARHLGALVDSMGLGEEPATMLFEDGPRGRGRRGGR